MGLAFDFGKGVRLVGSLGHTPTDEPGSNFVSHVGKWPGSGCWHYARLVPSQWPLTRLGGGKGGVAEMQC